MKQLLTNTLQIDNEKYQITKRLYLELYSQMNFISDYDKCRKYVREAMNKCVREIRKVTEFEKNKIDIIL